MTAEHLYTSDSSILAGVDYESHPGVALNKIKRCSDITLCVIALLFLLPGLLIITAAVAIDMRGKVFFTQQRGGLGGRPFKILKFRTMRVTEDGAVVVQATRGDPRVTPLGALLRRSSLDELPQLINVIKGDMSLVGPRPHALAHDEAFAAIHPLYLKRMHARPGLTGLAQVSGCRGEIQCTEDLLRRTHHDLEYICKWSPRLDIKILLITCVKGMFDRNAY